MTLTEIKTTLNNCYKLIRLRNIQEKLLNEARADVENLKGTDYSTERVAGGVGQSSIELLLDRVMRREQQYKDTCRRLCLLESTAEELIALTYQKTTIYNIMKEHFLNGRDVMDIARERYMSYQVAYNNISKGYQTILRAVG